MKRKSPYDFELNLPPELGLHDEKLQALLEDKFAPKHKFWKVSKRAIDARKGKISIFLAGHFLENPPSVNYHPPSESVQNNPEIHIVGAGPAGMFAALKALELGFKPILFERGKEVRGRRRDIAKLSKDGIVHPDSNYCFGEGGAGTYSDGKLYTRSKKRGDIEEVMEMLVAHGAKNDILIDARPHIGTNKLPKVITSIRETIVSRGGQFLFDTRLVDMDIKAGKITHLHLSTGEKIPVNKVLLATGHSAKDIYYLLHDKNILIEAKPFALGVRIEHPQSYVDSIQYKCETRGDLLPPAYYKLTTKITSSGKGVFSFCMCPGGYIVPAATEDNALVVNGMSPSRRNGRFANSGMVVSVDENDWQEYTKFGPLAGLKYQQAIEEQAFKVGGGGQIAPAQRVLDFMEGHISKNLPQTSYHRGIHSTDLREVLPPPISENLKKGLSFFGSKMKDYLHEDAVLVGVESRTSSPVKIPRNNETMAHPQIPNLFPVGEGAGYAGGIVSAAMDGIKAMKAIAEQMKIRG